MEEPSDHVEISKPPCNQSVSTPSQPPLYNTIDEQEYEDEEEEEEDIDFNPFLKDTPSREPSSSLSSDIETLDGELVNSITQSLDVREGIEEIGMQSNAQSDTVILQTHEQVSISDEEEEEEEDDAICKRTRAKYSLENFTLDDLEAFLQETDDEDDIFNVDDEEEYRKFLAAVLHSGDGDGEVQLVESGNNDDDDDDDDDDDEDIDLDFEIELEEALETDDEETIPEKVQPVTRQKKRRQNNSSQSRNNSNEQDQRLLRPLVPILPIPQPVRTMSPTATEVVKESPRNSFTQSQIGELNSLIQDHIQLLIQVYSLCAFDHSRQSIGTQVHKLLSDMISRPLTSPSSSVLDLVDKSKKYLVDVSTAVQDYRRCQVESNLEATSQRIPLFPLPQQEVVPVLNNSPSTPSPKKTLAGALVESAKKQSVAFVHKDIAKLAQRFLPLFKVSLYPHKPPAAAISNRFLFTDAEDELLALGIMEYNSDWKAIKQRFLPCKGEHQIYVRQKNRRSSKASENPIKAVLRMKSAPLTPHEIVRIQEGLNYFKYDWMSVWRYIVPHRDPSLLPRQLRTALGIQKSYKLEGVQREKRRVYDTNRKARVQQAYAEKVHHGASKANGNHVGGDESVDNSGEAYLHEGFLADWRPGMPKPFYSTSIHSSDKAKDVVPPGVTCTGEVSKNPGAQILTCIPLYRHTSVTTTPASSMTPIVMRSYRGRNQKNRSIVRLAPGLPPVNLPSSVRVISQSNFEKSNPKTPSKTVIVKSVTPDVSVPKPPDNNVPPREKVVEDVPAESSSGIGESTNDSDLQMHPLLFRPPENGQITTCYPSSGGSSAFSFFPDNRPQLLSLFNSPRQIDHSAADQSKKKSSLNETAIGDSCFHPLLQRTDGETSYLTSRKKSKLRQLQDTTSVANKRAKNVNLDINLSPSPSKDNNVSAAKVSRDLSDNCLIQRNDDDSGVVAGSNEIDDMGDQSNLGIVMEQEELSDSDEEMMEEENVEFECEEMTDSEGEDVSDCEETIERQNKRRSSEVEIGSTDVDSPNSPWLSLDPSSSRSSSKFKDIEKTEPAKKQCGSSRSSRKRWTSVKSRDAGVVRLRLGPRDGEVG